MNAIDTIVSHGKPNERQLATVIRRCGAALLRGMDALDRMADRRRSRLALMEMTDDQLKDVGISRGEAYREGIRPFWD